MKYVMCLGFLVLAGCTSNPSSPRDPSSDVIWNLHSIALNSKAIAGACDLSPSVEIRRSSLLSTTSVVGNLDTKVCHFKGSSISTLSSAVINASYLVSRPKVISVEVKVGDMEYANTEADDEALSAKGYTDVHMTGSGVYKLKATSTNVFKGACGEPTLVGFYGFRKTMVSCSFAGGAGTISLVKE